MKSAGSSTGHYFSAFRCIGFLCASMYLTVSGNTNRASYPLRQGQNTWNLRARRKGCPKFAVGDPGNKTLQQTRCDREGLCCPKPLLCGLQPCGEHDDEDRCLHRWGLNPLAVPDFVEILIAESQAHITRGP